MSNPEPTVTVVSLGAYSVEQSKVTDSSLEGICEHCGSPIVEGDLRHVEVGHVEVGHGTFAIGCSLICCFEAALTQTELLSDWRELQRREKLS